MPELAGGNMALTFPADPLGGARPATAVIVTFNGARWIVACLQSLQSEYVDQIIVVDNASTDDTVQLVRQTSPSVIVIRSPENEGFGRANNIGIQKALDLGAEYVCLINQDLTVEPGCISKLVAALRTSDDMGMASALQLNYHGSAIDPAFKTYLPEVFWDDLFARSVGSSYDVEFAPAAAVAIPAKQLFKLGGFDPLFFMYGEDTDFCLRMRRAGLRISIVPDARVKHWHGLLNLKRTFQWNCNLEYTQLVLHLKQSRRVFGIALLSWLRWTGFPKSPGQFVARIVGIWRCLRRVRQIAAHRVAVPFPFRGGSAGRLAEGSQSVARNDATVATAGSSVS
jgi:GT2 family glycosyltransferase